MEFHFADDLLEAIAEKNAPVCVGLDPVYEKLPPELRPVVKDEAEHIDGLEKFCSQVLELVAPIVPAIKIQSAYFERYGWAGVRLYEKMIALAQDMDLLVIGDVKRNDIGSTAQAYAQGHLVGLDSPMGPAGGRADALTVNGYFGADGLSPFIELANQEGKGLFILVRTSNPSARTVQDFTDSGGKKFFEHLADMVADLGGDNALVGTGGYSCVGAVVGATYPDEARLLRKLMPRQIFLVPGYGAQGASANDCAAAFKDDGTGAIVNASRSVIFAYLDKKYADMDWKDAIQTAAKSFALDIVNALKP